MYYAIDVIFYKVLNKGEVCLYFDLRIWITKYDFDIFHDVSNNVTMVKFMETLDNVIHNCAVDGV